MLEHPSPVPDLCLKTIYKECGPDKGTVDTYKLELSPGFGYRTLLGEMMYGMPYMRMLCVDLILVMLSLP